MTLLTPELLLVGLPLGWVLLRSSSFPSWRFALRAAMLLCLLAALGGLAGGGDVRGRDTVLLLDRSHSMPGGAATSATELAGLLREGLQPGDRLAVMGFGADVALEQPLGDTGAFAGFRGHVDPHASHLANALDRALALIPEHRPGSILLLSDGEYHGALPDDAARRAALRGVRLDVRGFADDAGIDVAVERLELPESVGLGEHFQFAAWLSSDRATDAEWRLLRGEEVIARGTRALTRGRNQLLFRDVASRAGLARYRLLVTAPGDRVPENDRGLAVTRVEGRRALLLLNDTGAPGRLAAALRGAGLNLEVLAPEDLPDGDALDFDRWSGVVLENVAADRLGPRLVGLATQVRDLGLGLLVTGGRASFGVGGYYRSALEPVLPVTMELRVEHRKLALALAIVLDRSGSMSAPTADGRTKMDLANAGALEAIRLLSPMDEVAVIAVDSSDHVVVSLRPVDDFAGIAERVSGIRSMGGGIFVYTGLLAAAHQLEGASAAGRHVILFADAADAEEPGDYAELIGQLTDERATTVSVVALGGPRDTDADFLRDVAERGGGQVYFTRSARELPRLFAQDTLLAARAAFVEEPAPTRATGALLAVSPTAGAGPWVTLPGYNLTYLRPAATAGVLTTDEFTAPVIATLQAGLGRSAVFTGQVDGASGIAAADWPEVADLVVTLARWITGQEPPDRWFPSVRRDGREALVTVEVDRGAPGSGAGDDALEVHLVAPDGSATVAPLQRTSPDRYEARLPLAGEGVYRLAAVTGGGEVLPVAPLAVPFSPEFTVRTEATEGLATLGRLARLGRGRLNPSVRDVLAGERSARGLVPWTPHATLLALLLLLGEILWRRWYERSLASRATPARAADATAPAASWGTPSTTGHASPRPPKASASGDDMDEADPAPDAADPPPRPTLDDILRDTRRRGR